MRRFAWFVCLLLAGPGTAWAQAPTGYASVLVDHVPNRDATEMRARLFAQEKADVGAGLRLTASGFVEGLLADRGGRTTDVAAEPQELLLELRAKHLAVTAGMGRVVWGRLDELQPTDVVNPIDVSRFFFEGRSEARMSVPLVRGTFFANDKASVETVYVPWFRRGRFDRLAESSSPFNLAPRIPIVDQSPARTFGNAQGGARANLTTGRIDWSVSTYRGFRPFGLYSAVGPAELARVYPRFTMVGGDVETVSGAWVVRGEIAAFVRDAFQAADAPLVRAGRSFDAGGGVDRKAGAYRVSGQVLVHREEYDVTADTVLLPRARTDVSLIASADRSFARQRYESRLFGVYNPASGAGFVRGILTATLRDNVALEGSLGWFGGSGSDTIGLFSDSDFTYVRLKYSF
ncbi:MAG TPA: hypothetical protein VEL51_24275 [Vicinamibacterales bacterium]|nr:hypothetical protein [Vicinamibacterales bacterium]